MVSRKSESKVVGPKYVLQDGDRITITPRAMRVEGPTPLLRQFVRFIESKGFQSDGNGKGDHERYKSPDGKLLVLNVDKRDPKHVDIASVKSLAKISGRSYGEITTEIARFDA